MIDKWHVIFATHHHVIVGLLIVKLDNDKEYALISKVNYENNECIYCRG